MAKLECNTCGEHLETTDQASLDAFREQHAHVFEDRDEFGMIFENNAYSVPFPGGIESNVAQLPFPAAFADVKTANPNVFGGGSTAPVEKKKRNAGFDYKRRRLEKLLLTEVSYFCEDNLTMMDFLDFVQKSLQAFDDAHTKSGVGPYD